MRKLSVRPAEAHDIPAIMQLLEQVAAVHHLARPDLFGIGTKYTAEELHQILSDPATPVFVCQDEAGAVHGHAFCIHQYSGSSHVLRDIHTLYIDDICVLETSRRLGVGRTLYQYVLDYARQQGCYNVTLNVWEGNPGAKQFYEEMGMQPYKYGMEAIL